MQLSHTGQHDQNIDGQADKFSYESIMKTKKIKKGETRWNQCAEQLNSYNKDLLSGPILDFGSGVGYFVHEGLKRGYDIWGIDILPGKVKRFNHLVDYSNSPEKWKQRCLQASGSALPFSNDSFSAVTSWFVFEHIENTGEALREMVRVTRPGGVIVIRAQDARCNWEGHCKIPWLPFLPKFLEKIWIEEFSRPFSLREGVVEITQPQIISILETLGCSILKADEPPLAQIPVQPFCGNADEVRQLARKVKKEFEKGNFTPRQDGLYLYAVKQ